jgi:hypothetical protein
MSAAAQTTEVLKAKSVPLYLQKRRGFLKILKRSLEFKVILSIGNFLIWFNIRTTEVPHNKFNISSNQNHFLFIFT